MPELNQNNDNQNDAVKSMDVVIVGGGPAGIAAAVKLYDKGIRDILILERESKLGGILKQCIHDGFGLARFGESLSGPEYADRFIKEIEKRNIRYITDTTVIDITPDKKVTAAHKDGLIEVNARAVILTMGCRERTRGALAIPGTRPSGVMTAGVAQAYINLQNRMPGREVIILGSGDIGMIMARRLTLEGAHVIGVFEVMSVPSGLPRNIRQCLDDYDIPLYLSHTVSDIKGRDRLESVVISRVDEKLCPIPGTEKEYSCDTLILSVGLIPENELSIGAGVIIDEKTKGALVDEYYQTNIPGIFAAGNVLHVHDLVDFVSMEAEKLAEGAALYVREGELPDSCMTISTGDNIGHIIPQKVSGKEDFRLSLRVRKPLYGAEIRVISGDRIIARKALKKALPAEMIQVDVKAEDIIETDKLEVMAI